MTTEVLDAPTQSVETAPRLKPWELVLQYFQFPKEIGGNPFDPRPLQIQAINDLAPLSNQGHWLDMGCVDAHTEYLSPTGWRKISDYDGGQVAQYTPDNDTEGKMSFVQPLAYIKKPCSSMLHFSTTRGVDQMLSDDHRVVYVSPTGRLKEMPASQVADAHAAAKMGWKGRFITTFKGDGPGLALTDAELRLTVAVIADGHFPTPYAACQLRVKKPRKVERLTRLLDEAGIAYEVTQEPWDGCEGFHRFKFRAPMSTRVFGPQFYQASAAQLAVIADEVRYWDGSVSSDPGRGFRFSSSEKQSADFVQYALSATGTRCTLTRVERSREGRPDWVEYNVQTFGSTKLAYLTGCKQTKDGSVKTEPISRVPTLDGFQYCFTVPSSYLILRRNGCVFVTGNCGKTFVASAVALYLKIVYGYRIVVIMPPLLVRQWAKWLALIKPSLTVTEYAGPPKKRAELDLDVDVVLVGIQIFKKDYERFRGFFDGKDYTVIVDEAMMVANIGSDQHEKVYDFAIGMTQMLLTGTLGLPMHAYGLLKFTAPGSYRNFKQFENLHVEERDFFDAPTKYCNLELLNANLAKNSKRILYSDMFKDVEEPFFNRIPYDLTPEHYKLYRRLAEEQLLLLPNGGKIDATSASKLVHALGQIVVNPGHFAGDSSFVSNAIGIVEQKLSELGNGKLVVFCHYRLTVANLLQRFGASAVAINGIMTPAQKQASIDRFINDPSCTMAVVQFKTGSKGLDGFQHVAHHCMFAEPCSDPDTFHQAVARLKRGGQKNRVMVHLPVAERTIQVRRFKNLLDNDHIAGQLVRTVGELRSMIFGE